MKKLPKAYEYRFLDEHTLGISRKEQGTEDWKAVIVLAIGLAVCIAWLLLS